MTTRRNFLTLVGAGAALTVAGCSTRTLTSTSPQAAPDVLLVDTVDGLVAVRGTSMRGYGPAAVTPDGATIYAARTVGTDTDLLTVASASGQVAGVTRLPGAWLPLSAGASGKSVALVPLGHGNPYAPAGRTASRMLVARAGTAPMTLNLAGNWVPDTFTLDDSGLFAIEWLPSAAPDHYRVRGIDFATGRPTQLFTRDKVPVPVGAEDKMRGVRGNAVFGSSDTVLFTLYTRQPGTTPAPTGVEWDNAFIHTLHLAERWTFCVDLPKPFGLDPNAGHALAITPDDTGLFVVDATGGRVALVDTASLGVVRTAKLPARAGAAYAAVTTDTLFVGAGGEVRLVDRGSLAVRSAWGVPGEVRGLVRSADGARLYVALPDAVQCRDVATGRTLSTSAVPGVTGLRTVI
jgi:hypothetical protein